MSYDSYDMRDIHWDIYSPMNELVLVPGNILRLSTNTNVKLQLRVSNNSLRFKCSLLMLNFKPSKYLTVYQWSHVNSEQCNSC